MNYEKYNMKDRAERVQFLRELYEDRTDNCDGCVYLRINPPNKLATGCNVDVWRDSYKAICEYYDCSWITRQRNVLRLVPCILSETREEAKL